MTKLDLINMALDTIEAEPIASLTINSTGRRLNRWYGPAARYVLTYHPWQEAVYWEVLESEYKVTYTSAASGNDSGDTTLVVQEAIAGIVPQQGDLSITINGTAYTHPYTSWTTSTFTLTTGLEATCDGSDTATTTPNNHNDVWDCMYSVPSTAMHVLDIRGEAQYDFIVEGGFIYTNQHDSVYGFGVRFIKDISAESGGSLQYSDSIAECIAARIAFNVAPAARKQELRGMFEDILHDAVYEDGDEAMSENANGVRFVTELS